MMFAFLFDEDGALLNYVTVRRHAQSGLRSAGCDGDLPGDLPGELSTRSAALNGDPSICPFDPAVCYTSSTKAR